MISLMKLLLEVSPAQADKDNMAARKVDGSTGYNPNAAAEKQKMGVPANATHAGFGRWIDSSGKTLGFTRGGKFVAASPDADKKAAARSMGVRDPKAVAAAPDAAFAKHNTVTANPERSQQARSAREKSDTANAQKASVQQRAKKTAFNAVDKLQQRWGATSSKSHSSGKYKEMVSGGTVAENPLSNASDDDKEVIGVPLADYMKNTGAQRREIDAVGKYNQKYGDKGPMGNGAPLGTYDGEDGSSWVILRKRKGMFDK